MTINSIRHFLLINILLATVFITSLSAASAYYFSQSTVNQHMDALLEQMGLSFSTVVSTTLKNEGDLNDIENELRLIQNETDYPHAKNSNIFFSKSKYYFQLYNNQDKLLLYSPKVSHVDLNKVPSGLSDFRVNNQDWRVFKIINLKRQLTFVVGEQYNERNQLLRRIARSTFYIMLLTFPLAGLLIWFIVGWGFKSMTRITTDISNRAPTYLESVDLNEVPIEIKPLIQELNHLFSRLHETFEREKRFAGDAAHELRTPLAALKTQVQVILKTSAEKDRQQLLEKLIASVDRITHIIQQLLILSRLVPEAASVYDLIDINLPKISAEVIAQLVPLALEKNIDISLDAPDNLTLKGNLTGISILIRNLVDNAIRYTPNNGQVTVEITHTLDCIILKISDTGIGIPEELRSRVFERFYRIMGTNVSGSGLGLAIVQQIAKLHHAELKLATPEHGHGLQIEVWFKK